MPHQILLLSGMTRDEHLFDKLSPLLPDATIVRWIEPLSGESIRDYSKRLAATISVQSDCVVCGVSFGGIVALELAAILDGCCCILISSIHDPSQLPPRLRLWRYCAIPGFEKFLALIGRTCLRIPSNVRTNSTARLTKLAGDAGAWHRWATTAVLRWSPRKDSNGIPLFHIHGDADSTFPVRYVRPDFLIPGGGHALPLTHPKEVAAAILEAIRKVERRTKPAN